MNKDARVAEIIEPKPELPGNELAELATYLRGRTKSSAGKAWMLVFDYETGDKPEWEPRTFISAPSYETDGIVLEWVQKASRKIFGHFAMSLSGAIYNRMSETEIELSKNGMFDIIWIKHYKPGDYARALLEVSDNE